MRTTIELSDRTYKRLRAAATERGLRGFSPLVEEAIALYLEREDERRDVIRAIEEAQGAWSEEDVREWEEARASAWATWRSDPS